MRRFTLLCAAGLSVVLIACGQPPQDVAGPAPGAVALLECDAPLITVFSPAIANVPALGEFFIVSAAVPLPDGGIVLSYDPDAPEAGDESNLGSPRLVHLEPDGTITEFPLPVVEGVQAPPSTRPLVADAAGTLYMYDDAAMRVVARDPSGEWRMVMPIAQGTVVSAPQAAIGPDGDLFLATVAGVVRIGRDGQETTIAGSLSRRINDITFPEPPMRGLPRPVTAVNLHVLTGLVVADDGIIYLSTRNTVLEISTDGILSMVADGSADGGVGDGQVAIPTDPDPREVSVFTGLALDRDGSLLVADTGQQRLLRISASGAEVLMTNISSVNGGSVVGRAPTTDLIVFQAGGVLACTLPGEG